MPERTTVRIIHPVDLARPKVGGIHAFISTFVKFLPDDLAVEHVGLTGRGGPPVRRWSEVEVEGRAIRAFPLLEQGDVEHRARVPLGARFAAALWRAAPSLRAGAQIAQFHRPGLALPAVGWPMRRIQVVHLSADQLRSAGSESRWRRLGGGLRRIEGRVLPRMDWIVAVSEDAADEYRQAFPALGERISFLSNWVDDTVFAPLGPDERRQARAALAAEMGGGSTDRLIVAVGRLERQKQPLLALRALDRLPDATVHLGFVGEGSLRDELRRAIAEMGLGARVRILPTRARGDLARLLNAADALLIASAHETGPTVAYEALACGLPVASTPVGRVPALVAGTEAGVISDGFTPEAVAAALAAVLAVPDRERARSAAVAAATPYAARTVLQPFYERHRALAAGRGG